MPAPFSAKSLARAGRRSLLHTTLACAVAALPGLGAAAADVQVVPREAWTGRAPLGVPPPLQSSIGTREDLARIWTQCQVKGTPPALDFGRSIVLLAVRRGSTVRFAPGKLADGNLATNVVVAPDMPAYLTCALAVVDRKGIAKVNGAPIGQ